MSGGKKGSKKYWIDYYISLHYGFCSAADALTKVTMNEKEIFSGSIESNIAWPINLPNLFGGNEREGGAVGMMHVMLGGDDQLAPAMLAARVGRTPLTMPGFRKLATLFFTGLTTYDGFNVGSNSPQVPQIAARFRRACTTLGVPGGIIANDSGLYDVNPSHLIYELLCGPDDWTMGGSPSALDTDSFVYAANVLYQEQFGLSLAWTKQTTIEALVQEILDHIQGMFFFNPATGKGTLKLLRGDYDINTIPTLGPDQMKVRQFRRKLWGETVNEVTIQYTRPDTEETDTVTYQDPGNIAMQGEVVNQTSNYYAIRSSTLAAFVGARDITSASQPLASAEIDVDRRQWTILPGDVFKMTAPKLDILSVVMRVMEVDYGNVNSAVIKLTLLEDVYALQESRFVQLPPPSKWEDPSQDPNTGNNGDMNPGVLFLAMPYPQSVQTVGTIDPLDSRFPEIFDKPLVVPRAGQTDIMSYVLWEKGTDSTGAELFYDAGEKTLTGMRDLAAAQPQEAISTIIIDPEFIVGRHYPEQGAIAVIYGDSAEGGWCTEAAVEYIQFLAYQGNNAWLVARGIWDTIPRAWGSSAAIFFLDYSWRSYDQSVADVDITYRIQPRTSKGLRDLELCPDQLDNRPARPYFPFRPANCRIDGVLFPEYDQTQNYNPRNWSMILTWSNRNRLLEDSIYLKWTDPGVPMEAGQENVIALQGGAATPKFIQQGSSESYSLDVGQSGRSNELWITYYSFLHTGVAERRLSLQAYQPKCLLYPKGYGSDWGYFWGGWPEEFGIGITLEALEET